MVVRRSFGRRVWRVWEQIPALLFNRLDHSTFDMWLGVVMMKDDVVLLARSLGLDGCMEAVELSQINVAVDRVLLFSIFIRNGPSMLHVVVVPPETEALLANFGNDLPMDNATSVPPNTLHSLFAMQVLRNTLRSLARINTDFLPFCIFEQQPRLVTSNQIVQEWALFVS